MNSTLGKNSEGLRLGLLLIFICVLVEIILPNLFGFMTPFMYGFFSIGDGTLPAWIRWIYPFAGFVGFAGVRVTVFAARSYFKTPRELVIRFLFAALATVDVVLRFLATGTKGYPGMEPVLFLLELAEVAVVSVGCLYFAILSLKFGRGTMVKTWLRLAIAYLIFSVILYELINPLVYAWTVTNLSGLSHQLAHWALYLVLVGPTWIWGLRLLLRQRQSIL